MSPYTLAKQRSHHPEITDADYARLPSLLQHGEVIPSPMPLRVVVVHEQEKWYLAVVKTDQKRREAYLVSFRQSNLADVERERRKASKVRAKK